MNKKRPEKKSYILHKEKGQFLTKAGKKVKVKKKKRITPKQSYIFHKANEGTVIKEKSNPALSYVLHKEGEKS